MKTFWNLKKTALVITLTMVALGTSLLTGCTEHPISTLSKPSRALPSYTLPSTITKFNAGLIHNAELYYIFTHYDTVKYASYPNKFSQTGIDSLAALFIADSLQTATGSLTSGEISQAEAVFDSTFNACLTAVPTHSQLVASVDTAEAHGILASDEGNFIINADTEIRLCSSYAQTNDTIGSLTTQYNSITWAPSTSHGVEAYEYLNIANHSCKFWGQPGDTIPIHPPVSADAGAYVEYYNLYEGMAANMGWTQSEVLVMAVEASTGASAGSSTTGGGGVQWGRLGIAAIITVVWILVIVLIFF
jgi:hypothetical protein